MIKSLTLAAIFMVSAGAQALEVSDKSCEEGHPDYWVLSEEIFLDCKFGDPDVSMYPNARIGETDSEYEQRSRDLAHAELRKSFLDGTITGDEYQKCAELIEYYGGNEDYKGKHTEF